MQVSLSSLDAPDVTTGLLSRYASRSLHVIHHVTLKYAEIHVDEGS